MGTVNEQFHEDWLNFFSQECIVKFGGSASQSYDCNASYES